MGHAFAAAAAAAAAAKGVAEVLVKLMADAAGVVIIAGGYILAAPMVLVEQVAEQVERLPAKPKKVLAQMASTPIIATGYAIGHAVDAIGHAVDAAAAAAAAAKGVVDFVVEIVAEAVRLLAAQLKRMTAQLVAAAGLAAVVPQPAAILDGYKPIPHPPFGGQYGRIGKSLEDPGSFPLLSDVEGTHMPYPSRAVRIPPNTFDVRVPSRPLVFYPQRPLPLVSKQAGMWKTVKIGSLPYWKAILTAVRSYFHHVGLYFHHVVQYGQNAAQSVYREALVPLLHQLARYGRNAAQSAVKAIEMATESAVIAAELIIGDASTRVAELALAARMTKDHYMCSISLVTYVLVDPLVQTMRIAWYHMEGMVGSYSDAAKNSVFQARITLMNALHTLSQDWRYWMYHLLLRQRGLVRFRLPSPVPSTARANKQSRGTLVKAVGIAALAGGMRLAPIQRPPAPAPPLGAPKSPSHFSTIPSERDSPAPAEAEKADWNLRLASAAEADPPPPGGFPARPADKNQRILFKQVIKDIQRKEEAAAEQLHHRAIGYTMEPNKLARKNQRYAVQRISAWNRLPPQKRGPFTPKPPSPLKPGDSTRFDTNLRAYLDTYGGAESQYYYTEDAEKADRWESARAGAEIAQQQAKVLDEQQQAKLEREEKGRVRAEKKERDRERDRAEKEKKDLAAKKKQDSEWAKAVEEAAIRDGIAIQAAKAAADDARQAAAAVFTTSLSAAKATYLKTIGDALSSVTQRMPDLVAPREELNESLSTAANTYRESINRHALEPADGDSAEAQCKIAYDSASNAARVKLIEMYRLNEAHFARKESKKRVSEEDPKKTYGSTDAAGRHYNNLPLSTDAMGRIYKNRKPNPGPDDADAGADAIPYTHSDAIPWQKPNLQDPGNRAAKIAQEFESAQEGLVFLSAARRPYRLSYDLEPMVVKYDPQYSATRHDNWQWNKNKLSAALKDLGRRGTTYSNRRAEPYKARRYR
jgi:hypothetical protein